MIYMYLIINKIPGNFFTQKVSWCYKNITKKGLTAWSIPFFVIFILNVYYSAIKISRIWLADLATEEPGPNIAATPALYKKS